MPRYLVSWTIDIDAPDTRAAAKQALEIQRDPNSIATVFQVYGPDNAREAVQIDLLKPKPRPTHKRRNKNV